MTTRAIHTQPAARTTNRVQQRKRCWRRRLRTARRLKVTREGRYFLVMTVAIGLAAVNTGNNLLYLLIGWLLSAIVASGLMSELSLRKLRVEHLPPPRIFAKRPFVMELMVHNDKHRLSSYSVEIQDIVRGKPLDKTAYFLKVPPGQTQRTSYRHTFARRGEYHFNVVRTASKYPFALFRKSRNIASDTQVLVYPAVFPVPPALPRAHHSGDTVAQTLGRSGEFFGLREYRTGDDKHDVHWLSSARAGKMMVREYEQEAQRRTTIVIDNALPQDPDAKLNEALESAISLAASLASTYIKLGYQVRLVARGSALPFSGGPMQLGRILNRLALLDTVLPTEPFAGNLDPSVDNILVVPHGGGGSAPPGITHVMEPG